MADFNINEALNSLLSDPETGEKLSSLISSLSGEGEAPDEKTSDFPDIGKIMKIKELYDSAIKETDSHTALLKSLKPYLSEEKGKNLDSLMKMLKIYKLITKAKDTPLLKELF